jgi:HSP20 family molecular chaperone IbpA
MNTRVEHQLSSEDPQDTQTFRFQWRTHRRSQSRPHAWRPPTDLYETEGALVVRVEVGGMQPQEFSISLEERLLTIQGVRTDVAERRAFHQMEVNFGEFSSQVRLPCAVDASLVEAQYRQGFLLIVLPKAQPHEVEIDG